MLTGGNPQSEEHRIQSSARASEQYTTSSREPINEHGTQPNDPYVETVPAAPPPATMSAQEAEQLNAEQMIANVVNQVVIHSNKPMENLPDLPLAELKVIGRCIIFTVETVVDGAARVMHYQGLVSTINKDTVSLIHVHRFTEEDFQAHFDEEVETIRLEQEAATRSRGQVPQGELDEPATFPRSDAETEVSRSRGAGFAAPSRGVRANCHAAEDDSLALAADHTAEASERNGTDGSAEDHRDTNHRVRNRLRDHRGSMGPIPFATFSRSHIHNVQFGRDPRSDFYSLFRDPTKYFFDMQCLRMFCRRYIVHTAQGNNPRQVPLRAFVTCRCNCNDLDNDLLVTVTKEEVVHLAKIARDIKRKKRPVVQRQASRAASDPNAPMTILHGSCIPRQMWAFGISLCAMAAIAGSVLIIGFQIDRDRVIQLYIRTFIAYVVSGVVVWVVTGMALVKVSRNMRVPVTIVSIKYGILLVLLLGTFATGILCVVVVSRTFSPNDLFKFITTTRQPIELPRYYRAHGCSGFYSNCFDLSLVEWFALRCYEAYPSWNGPPCQASMMAEVRKKTIFIVASACVAVVIDSLALWAFHKALILTRRANNGEFEGYSPR